MNFSIPLEKAAIQYNGGDYVNVYSLCFGWWCVIVLWWWCVIVLWWWCVIVLGGGASLYCGVVPGVVYGLQFVLVALSGHTHLLFSKKD